MTYNETLEYLYNSTPVFERVGASAYKEGLENTIALDNHFGNPHRSFKTIHVAGTNGKGSTSHTIAALLQCAGYRVGLYTSPHLVDFSERIRVNGEPVEQQFVIDFVEKHKDFFEPLHPSFFELATAMAFKYFEEQKVDIAVIEVGLGGRLDCTNIISPLLTVITNISFDHTGFLGDTLAKIAGEKAGIMKEGVPCVIGEYVEETLPVFEKKAQEMDAKLILAQDNDYEIPDFQLKGACQSRNAKTIMAAYEELVGMGVVSDDRTLVEDAFAHVCDITHLRGRWEVINHEPLVVCDTGHNVAGWEYLAPQIKQQHCNQRHIVFGMVDDKDIDTVMGMLPDDATYYFCQASTHRAIPVERVAEIAKAHGLVGEEYHNVKDAYRAAIKKAAPDDFIFIGGSSYVVADLLTHLG